MFRSAQDDSAKGIHVVGKLKPSPIAWDLELEAYLELEVRDLPARIRGPSSSLCFGFPSASTPLPV